MTYLDLPFLVSGVRQDNLQTICLRRKSKNIKNIKLQHGALLSKDARIIAEMEIDSLISQMIGTFDSLLVRIIYKFQLSGIPSEKIKVDKVISVLSAQSKRIEVANEIEKAYQEGNWCWMIKHLRNHSMHGSLLSSDANLDVIPFFEQTLIRLREFIKNIKMKEPTLQ